jgi:uncharacterized protein involved in cysteine biosynthesis
MSNSLTQGAGYALTGLRWLPKIRFAPLRSMPLLINVVLFGAGIWWTYGQFEHFDQILQRLAANLAGLAALADLADICPDRVGRGVLHLFGVTNLLAAPFNTLLAAQVEKQARSAVNTARPA